MYVIIHTLLGVSLFWKVQNNPVVNSGSTYEEICCIFKAVDNTNSVSCYMEYFPLNTRSPTVYLKNNKSCISTIEANIVTSMVKQIDVTVFIYKLNMKIVYLFKNM